MSTRTGLRMECAWVHSEGFLTGVGSDLSDNGLQGTGRELGWARKKLTVLRISGLESHPPC